eukprot:2170858-Rhodomonas_salina.3
MCASSSLPLSQQNQVRTGLGIAKTQEGDYFVAVLPDALVLFLWDRMPHVTPGIAGQSRCRCLARD